MPSDDREATNVPSRPEGGEPVLAVVGVGASAGGLPALERFLSAVTPAGIAYVVVQHLSPEHVSILPQILGSSCRLPVEAVTDGAVPRRSRPDDRGGPRTPSWLAAIPDRSRRTVGGSGRPWVEAEGVANLASGRLG